jgi:hypothetical protein
MGNITAGVFGEIQTAGRLIFSALKLRSRNAAEYIENVRQRFYEFWDRVLPVNRSIQNRRQRIAFLQTKAVAAKFR